MLWLVVAAVWGSAAAQLSLQSLLAALNLLIALAGFVRGLVPRRDTALGIGVCAFQVALFFLLLRGGTWFLSHVLRFGHTRPEAIVFWVFAAADAVFMLPQLPGKLRRTLAMSF